MTERKKRILIIAITVVVVLIVGLVILYMVFSFMSNQISGNKATVGLISTTRRKTSEDEENNESEEEQEKEKEEIEEIYAYNDSYAIRTFVNSNWSRINVNVSTDYEKDEDGNYVYDGYTVYSDNGTFVKYIIFNEDYDSEVIGELSVGATYDEIVDALGEPTFYNSSLGLCGYKTETVYAFFYDNKIVIYPNMSVVNNNLESFIFNYIEGNYQGNQTNFVVELRQNYDDFSAELDGENVVLTSLNRGMKIILNGTLEETTITIYNGYTKGNLISENLETMENIIDNSDEDLVYMYELEREQSE